MKTLFSVFLCVLPLLSLAERSETLPNHVSIYDARATEEVVLLEQDGMTVSAEHFELNGKNYASLKFKNTTNQDLRILWSVQLRGTDFPVNMDGTTQAYLTIPAGETAFFGKSNSTDPWMDLESRQWEEEIQVNIEIQNAL